MAAPRPAPSTVPIAALPSCALLADSTAPALCCCANWRQTASSSWKTGKGLLGAGITCTRGPIGDAAQPARSPSVTTLAVALHFVTMNSPLDLARRNLAPRRAAVLHGRIV